MYAEQREDDLEYIKAEKRLTLVEEELAEIKEEQRNLVPKNIRGKY